MKAILFLAAIGALGYFVWTRNAEQVPVNPHYVEIRAKQAHTGVELVGYGIMNSQEDCLKRSELVWKKLFAEGERYESVSLSCQSELPARYQDLFANQQFHATYIALDRGKPGERDGRFIIYGVPSSEVMRVCPAIVEQLKSTYSGKVQCIQGAIG